jgi:hypothetical protein
MKRFEEIKLFVDEGWQLNPSDARLLYKALEMAIDSAGSIAAGCIDGNDTVEYWLEKASVDT